MKLYIAGPMTGYPDYNFANFDRVAKLLREKGFMVINPAEIDRVYGYTEEILRTMSDREVKGIMKLIVMRDILAIFECDGIALLEGWEHSKGTQVEIALANLLNIPVKPYSQWIDS